MKNVYEFPSRTSTGATFSDPYSHRPKFAWSYTARAAGAVGAFITLPMISSAVSHTPLPLTMAVVSLMAGTCAGVIKYYFFPYRTTKYFDINNLPARNAPKPRITMRKAA